MRLIERLSRLSPPAFGGVVAAVSFVVYLVVYAVAHGVGAVETGVQDAATRGAVIAVVLGAVFAWDKGQRDTLGAGRDDESGDDTDGDG